jgi:hypothetical protein
MSILCGSLSQQHGSSLVCGQNRRHPDMEGSCDNNEQEVADIRHWVVPIKTIVLRNITQGLGFRRILWNEPGIGKWM